MSEEILDALMQFFAIIAKQDEGVMDNEVEYVHSFLISQLNSEKVEEYLAYFKKKAGVGEKQTDSDEKKLTSVKDSVRILGLCKKINKTLSANQKVVVLVRLFELVNADRNFSDQRMAIINTVAEVFNISKEEFADISTFVIEKEAQKLNFENILIVSSKENANDLSKFIRTEETDEDISLLRIKSCELYFLKYTGNQVVSLNGLVLDNKRIYLFAPGSTIKLPKGKPIYYSDVVSHYLADSDSARISFNVNNLFFTFPNGGIGLRDISLSEEQGKLVGIMGASGAGKTTLMNVLSGLTTPSSGNVLINGVDLHNDKQSIEGVIGYIPQDDLLIEELTVFQNLYYSAKLCFKDKSEKELSDLVDKTLRNLGLYERKDLKVGSPLNKMISGGQRKRLNIALELIREPSILFVDEPTSGLSSRDSENVMDLLRELTLKGKLIFVVIHQPSSDIYKMFDKMVILDTGGYLIYYGNPIEAVSYFKTADNQINSEIGECPTCGSVNPEIIFNIVEAKVVDEFGKYTNHRKVKPTEWENLYDNKVKVDKISDINEPPPKTLNIPRWFKQFIIYLTRDSLSKVSNTQYVILNLMEAPVLGFILSYLIRYIADPNSDVYIFRDNENFPRYIFMSIVVALFLGLTVSAEEIFKDRKILKREKFLNLSRSSYLFSKIIILTIIFAVQAFLFTLIGNSLLGVPGMFFEFWFCLFSTFILAGMIGLNISQSFNSAVTIYILIPIVMIPMMALGGAMFTFDKLNRSISSVGKVPIIAELMPSKWAYEALMVHQFKNNELSKNFYNIEKLESDADFKKVYYIPTLLEELDNIEKTFTEKKTDSINKVNEERLKLFRNEIGIQLRKAKGVEFEFYDKLNSKDFDEVVAFETRLYFDRLNEYYTEQFQSAYEIKERNLQFYIEKFGESFYNQQKNKFQNESIGEIVKNIYEKNKILVYDGRIIQQIDPVYLDPDDTGKFGFRSHLFSPKKYFLGVYYETFWFNIVILWIFTLLFYILLYFESLLILMEGFGKVNMFFSKFLNDKFAKINFSVPKIPFSRGLNIFKKKK